MQFAGCGLADCRVPTGRALLVQECQQVACWCRLPRVARLGQFRRVLCHPVQVVARRRQVHVQVVRCRPVHVACQASRRKAQCKASAEVSSGTVLRQCIFKEQIEWDGSLAFVGLLLSM